MGTRYNFGLLPESFQRKIIFANCPIPGVPEQCWIWQTSLNQGGYGRVSWNGRPNRMAHKVVYEILVEPPPPELEFDHLCRTHACVNPAHIELITHKENLARGLGIAIYNAALTHCRRGHEFTVANTYMWRGKRFCLICQSIRSKKFRERKITLDIQIAAD